MHSNQVKIRLIYRCALCISVILMVGGGDVFAKSEPWRDLLHAAHNVSAQARTALNFSMQGQDSAIGLALEALDSCKSLTVERLKAEVVTRTKLGDFYLLRNMALNAEREWITALGLASDLPPLDDECLYRLGLLYSKNDEAWAGEPEIQFRATAVIDTLLTRPSASDIPRLARLAEYYTVLWDIPKFRELEREIVRLWMADSTAHAEHAARALIYLAEGCSKPDLSNVGKSSEYQDSAIIFGTRALSIAESHEAVDDTMISFCAIRLGDYYSRLGHFNRAVALWEKASEINLRAFPPEHIEYQGSIYRMAGVYRALGRYAESERLYRQALDLRIRTQGPGHPETAGMHANLGRLLHLLGRYDEAEDHYMQALRIFEEAYERVDSDVASMLSLLGKLSFDRGEYHNAEMLFQRAIRVEEHANITNPSRMARRLLPLAELYRAWNQFPQARRALERALELQTEFLHGDDPDLAATRRRLAQVYIEQSDPDEATRILQQALTSLKPVAEYERKEMAECYFTMASAARTQQDHKGAAKFMMEGLEYLREVYPENDPRLLPSLILLADDHLEMDDSEQVKELMQEIERCSDGLEGTSHPLLAHAYEFESRYCQSVGRPEAATEWAGKAFWIRLDNLRDGATVMTERDALSAAVQMHRSRDDLLEQILSTAQPSEPLTVAADAILASKGVVSETALLRAQVALPGSDSATMALLDSLRAAQARLSHMYSSALRLRDSTTYLDGLRVAEEDVDRLKSEMAHLTSAGVRQRQSRSVGIADALRDILPDSAALVEYLACRFRDGDHYVALVITGDGGATVSDLGLAGNINRSIGDYRQHIAGLSARATGTDESSVPAYKDIMAGIERKIWDPLRGMVTAKSMLFISPDAELNALCWPAFIQQDGSYLVEEATVQYLSAGRDLLRDRRPGESSEGLLAIGDPDFGARRGTPGDVSDATQFALLDSVLADVRPSILRFADDLLKLHALPRLYGTRAEVEAIADIWTKSYGEPATTFLGAQATEQDLKSNARNHRVVHIATHGYFASAMDSRDLEVEPNTSVTALMQDFSPLLGSGLFLTGAEASAQRNSDSNMDDGLLTAEEIAGLDLTGTRWVVLSACETAQGTPATNEGLFGLRRAFQLAGANTVIGALWKVPDRETVEFMKELYRHAREPVSQAVRTAQLHVLHQLRREGRDDHPYHWASFIASGDWRPAF